MQKVIFSVIMPCYNSQEYVQNAIKSVTNQTYTDWEFIIVNDGSTDETLKIIESFSKKDSRIKVYSKENGGYATAVNTGLEHVSGEYFCFMGSDDILDTGLFEHIYENLCKLDYLPDAIAFKTVKIRSGVCQENDFFTSFSDIGHSKNTTFKQYTDEYPEHSLIFSVRDTSKLFKTSLLRDLRYFGKYGVTSDGVFSMLMAHRAVSFLSVPYDGYFWTLRDNSVSATLSLEKRIESICNWRKFFDIISTFDRNEIIAREISYVKLASKEIFELSTKIKFALKCHHFLRVNAKAFKKFLKTFGINTYKHTVMMSIISVSPVLCCIIEGARRGFAKFKK